MCAISFNEIDSFPSKGSNYIILINFYDMHVVITIFTDTQFGKRKCYSSDYLQVVSLQIFYFS